MNKYRVDVAKNRIVPCGMNSIRYIGDNWNKARKVFDTTATGFDSWDQENSCYGVILSVWCDSKNDYVVKCLKGL